MLVDSRAKKLFLERMGKNLNEKDSSKDVVFPFLDKLVEFKYIKIIDAIVAKKMTTDLDESLAVFLSFLSMASRQGHLCVNIQNKTLKPSLESVLSVEGEGQDVIQKLAFSKTGFRDLEQASRCLRNSSDKEERWKKLQKLECGVQTKSQFLSLLVSILEEIKNQFIEMIIEGANKSLTLPDLIKIDDSNFYIAKNWSLETLFLTKVSSFLTGKEPSISLDRKKVEKALSHLNLQDEQKVAVLAACDHGLTVITGGPGTGKTYTAGVLLQVIFDALSLEDKKNCEIVLAAPTGKAAANIDKSIRQSIKDNISIPKAKTIHQLLKINNERAENPPLLSADILVIDECSMMDVEMMGRLFSSIKPSARVILLGDKDQLPSIEAGSLFADMIEFLSSKRKSLVIELKKSLRTDSKAILDVAEKIKKGEVIDFLLSDEAVTFNFLEGDESSLFLNRVMHKFPVLDKIPEDVKALSQALSSFKILSPMKKGPFGVDNLNEQLYKAFLRSAKEKKISLVPIMITKNDYRLNLFNGEVGFLIYERETTDSGVYAIFISQGEESGVRKIHKLMLPPYEVAYCLSIHKAQGSEFDHVVLVLPEGSESFGRSLLYTGVTRAKKRLEIFSFSSVIEKMVAHISSRQSGVVKRLS